MHRKMFAVREIDIRTPARRTGDDATVGVGDQNVLHKSAVNAYRLEPVRQVEHGALAVILCAHQYRQLLHLCHGAGGVLLEGARQLAV